MEDRLALSQLGPADMDWLSHSPADSYDAVHVYTRTERTADNNETISIDAIQTSDAADKIWIDLSYPVVQSADGRTYKPLFAFYVEDLDNRLSMNVFGNLKPNASQSSWQAQPQQGFEWLVHLDRRFVSPLEQLQVSSFKPGELSQLFIVEPTSDDSAALDGFILRNRLYFSFNFGSHAIDPLDPSLQRLANSSPLTIAFRGGVQVAASDVNGDEVPTLVVPNAGSADLTVMLNREPFSTWTLSVGPRISTSRSSTLNGGVQVAAGDLNHDGAGDTFVPAVQSDGPIFVPAVQTDGPIIFQALFQRLAPRAPQYGAQINYAGDRLDIYFDPSYTVNRGNANSQPATDQATATITVSGIIWLVDDAATPTTSVVLSAPPPVGPTDAEASTDQNSHIITGAGSEQAGDDSPFDGPSLPALDSLFAQVPDLGLGAFVAGSR